jgi:ATP-dependent Clp protease protease subunit
MLGKSMHFLDWEDEKSSCQGDTLDEKLLEQRVLWLVGTITQESAAEFCKKLRYLDITWQRLGCPNLAEPVHCYISSSGGDKNATLGIVDIIQITSIPIVGIGVGEVASGAVWVLASFVGENKARLALPNTRFLVHEGWSAASGKPSDVKAFQREDERTLRIMAKLLAQFTGKDVEKIRRLMSRESYFGAQEAKRLGIIDRVWDPSEGGG